MPGIENFPGETHDLGRAVVPGCFQKTLSADALHWLGWLVLIQN